MKIRNPQSVRRGVAATELAVLLPFIALLLVAAVDFCRIYRDSQVVEEAARAGALYASATVRRTPGLSAEDAAKAAAVAAGVSLDPPTAVEDVVVSFEDQNMIVTVTHRSKTFTRYPGMPDLLIV